MQSFVIDGGERVLKTPTLPKANKGRADLGEKPKTVNFNVNAVTSVHPELAGERIKCQTWKKKKKNESAREQRVGPPRQLHYGQDTIEKSERDRFAS